MECVKCHHEFWPGDVGYKVTGISLDKDGEIKRGSYDVAGFICEVCWEDIIGVPAGA